MKDYSFCKSRPKVKAAIFFLYFCHETWSLIIEYGNRLIILKQLISLLGKKSKLNNMYPTVFVLHFLKASYIMERCLHFLIKDMCMVSLPVVIYVITSHQVLSYQYHEVFYRPRSEVDNVLGTVHLSICRPSVCTPLMAEPFVTYQSTVFVCVSLISGRMRIIARMRLLI